MFEQLNSRFARILKNIKGQGKITDENIKNTLREIRRAFLEADVNYKVAKLFMDRVKAKATGAEVFTSVTPGQQFVQILAKEMTVFLGEKNNGIRFNSSGKTIILLAGLQGSGKTTTAAKLACFLKKKRHFICPGTFMWTKINVPGAIMHPFYLQKSRHVTDR